MDVFTDRLQVIDDNRPNRPVVMLLFLQRASLKNHFQYINPLGLISLATFIGERGYAPRVFSGILGNAVFHLEREGERNTVSAVALYCDFENQSVVESFSRYLRERWKIVVLVGGPQGVALGRDFIVASRCNAVARGEGENTLLELLDCLVLKRGRLEEIKGISFLDSNGDCIVTPERELIRNPDTLPIQELSYLMNSPNDNFSVLTGRGCPFKCAFCYEGESSKALRIRSVDSVMAEIRHILKNNPGIRYVWFADDTFTLDSTRIEAFCDALSLLRRERDFVWFCEGHPRVLLKWPHLVKRMVDAGLVRMQIGIESGSRRVLEKYRKISSVEHVEALVRVCRDARLPQLCGNIIIGGAVETEETLDETWRFIRWLLDLGPGMLDIGLTFFMPFPETAITNAPQEYGLQILDGNASTSVGDYPVVETRNMSRERISDARRVLQERILSHMQRLLDGGKVSHEDILTHYRLRNEYGIASVWYLAVYTQSYFLNRRYLLMSVSGAERMADIPEDELWEWRPLRVFSLWNGISWHEKLPGIRDYLLSPFEYRLIQHCSGKSTLRRVVSRIHEEFGSRFDAPVDAGNMVLDILKKYESNNWVVFNPK